MEEAKATLGKSEEEVKQYAREGRLREFRDGPRLMFKADQVEQLKSDLASGGGGVPDLGVSDSGGLIGLVDTTGASGTSITLSEADTGQSSVAGLGALGGSGTGLRLSPGASASGINLANTGTGMGLSGTGAGGSIGGSLGGGSVAGGSAAGMSGSGLNLKGDTGLAADLGLSGSLGGVPSPGRVAGSGTGVGMAGSGGSGGRSGSGGGINVFGPDEDAVVDPGAQTAISGGIREQVNLEGVGSGSGLLDLTRESDDTSLGAVLDEITPGATGRRPGMADTGTVGTAAIAGISEEAAASSAAGSRRAAAATPVYVQQMDPMAVAFGGFALGGAIFVLFGIYVLIAALVGAYPDATSYFADKAFYIPFAFGLGVAVVCLVFGLLAGKMARR
jgi:hypothetical protein